jgi:glycosyltransferase involved in cell wall biosynthesis
LYLVGAGKEEKLLCNLVRELDLTGVEFVGPVERHSMPALYSESDILLNTSREDNAPVSILEAFASGLPVVTSDAGGIPYLVEHEFTGLVCGIEDWQALARNVVRLLQDGNLAQFLAFNARQVAEQYGWTAVRERWLEVYDSLRS